MSTTLITSRRQGEITTSTSSRRTPATSTSSQRASTTSTTQRKPSATPTSLRVASSSPTALPTNLASDFSFIQLETNPVPSATNSIDQPSLIDTSVGASETCSTDSNCTKDQTCSSSRCVAMNGAAPLGGSGPEPTSQLTPGSAIGIGVGVVGLVVLMVALGYWFWRIRARRPRPQTIEESSNDLRRCATNATDQRTLVASLPNSPQNAAFSQQQTMAPELFARALAFNDTKEKAGSKRSDSLDKKSRISTEKALPPRPTPHPLMSNPLPPPPTEPKRYAVNVNINKSMIFDDEMINAVSSLRGNDTPRSSGTPRDRKPQYKFEEYIPPTAKPPPVIISQPTPTTEKRNSEYELSQFPNRRNSADTVSIADDNSSKGGDSEPPSPIVETLSRLESKAPQLPLPDLPPPSPSFSFRSYDWYQDIIGDQPNGEPATPTLPSRNPARTPTQSTFPKPLSLSPKKTKPADLANLDSSLIPAPLSPAAPPAASGLLLHPSSAALPSPTSPNFRLSPTVYTPPSRQSPPIPPTAPLRSSARASTQSTMTRATHDSRSWLPDDGLYLAEEGDEYAEYKTYHRPSEDSRPTSYSPLT